MTFVATPYMWTPRPLTPNSNAPAFGTGRTIDASGEAVAAIIRVPKTGNLDKFEARLGTVTQAPGNGLKFSFQDVGTDGYPDGSPDQYRVVTAGLTTNAWVTPGLMTSDGTDTGTKRSVTAGDRLACVIGFESFSAGDNLQIACFSFDALSGQSNIPFLAHNTGSWTRPGNLQAVIALKYDDGTYAYVGGEIYPFNAFTSSAFNSGSTPDERGMIFQFPVAVKVAGAWWRMASAAGNSFRLKLYDSDGVTPLENIQIDSDDLQSVAGQNTQVWFTAERQLLANTNYRLTLLPDSVTNITLYEFSVNAAAIMDGFDVGQNWHLTTRTDAGSWTQTTTSRPFMGLLVSAIDTGGGGGPIFGGMVVR